MDGDGSRTELGAGRKRCRNRQDQRRCLTPDGSVAATGETNPRSGVAARCRSALDARTLTSSSRRATGRHRHRARSTPEFLSAHERLAQRRAPRLAGSMRPPLGALRRALKPAVRETSTPSAGRRHAPPRRPSLDRWRRRKNAHACPLCHEVKRKGIDMWREKGERRRRKKRKREATCQWGLQLCVCE